MSLHNLLNRLKSGVTDTSDTSEKSMGYQLKASTGAVCTLDTLDTSPTDCTETIAAIDAATPWPAHSDPGTTPEVLARIRAASPALDTEQAIDPAGIPEVYTGQVSSQVSTEIKEFGGTVKGKVTAKVSCEPKATSIEARGSVGVQFNQRNPESAPCESPHSSPLNGLEMDTFAVRRARLTDLGLSYDEASLLAEKLAQRDVDADDRRMCLECAHLRQGRSCGNWRYAGIAVHASGTRLPGDFVRMLQRCDGHQSAINSPIWT